MSLIIDTKTLNELVSKAVKGSSDNKMIPITSLISIVLKDNVLTLTTTDAMNILQVFKKDVEGDDFDVVVQTEMFSRLVMRMTSKTTKLTLKDSSLEVKGNGTYNIELPLDEDGLPIKFSAQKYEPGKQHEVKLSDIKSILTANKASLAETMEVPCLTGYYFNNENVLTTDRYKMCSNNINVFDDELLLPAELLDLLLLIDDEEIGVTIYDDKILFESSNVVITGYQLEGVEDYPASAITSYVTQQFQSVCELHKDNLLAALDRFTLFVTPFERNAVILTFTESGLVLDSVNNTATEVVKYEAVEDFVMFRCVIELELLIDQIKAQETEFVEMWFGHEKALKLVSNKVTQIVALLEDENE